MWLNQNMRRKVIKDEVGDVARYHYHIMKGLPG